MRHSAVHVACVFGPAPLPGAKVVTRKLLEAGLSPAVVGLAEAVARRRAPRESVHRPDVADAPTTEVARGGQRLARLFKIIIGFFPSSPVH